MLGDLLATASVDIAHAAAQRMPRPDMIVSTFLRMHREVEIGQVLDLAVELSPLDEPERLARESMNVFRWKTASYTTIAPLEFALLASGRDPRRAHADAMAIGLPLGQAFQLADDLLDVIGSSRSTGKPVGGDIREGKRTVLLADAISGADQRQRRTLIDMFSSQSRATTTYAGASSCSKAPRHRPIPPAHPRTVAGHASCHRGPAAPTAGRAHAHRDMHEVHPDHQSVEFSPTYVLEMPFSSRKNLTIQP